MLSGLRRSTVSGSCTVLRIQKCELFSPFAIVILLLQVSTVIKVQLNSFPGLHSRFSRWPSHKKSSRALALPHQAAFTLYI